VDSPQRNRPNEGARRCKNEKVPDPVASEALKKVKLSEDKAWVKYDSEILQ
jgi:hypothetical protein